MAEQENDSFALAIKALQEIVAGLESNPGDLISPSFQRSALGIIVSMNEVAILCGGRRREWRENQSRAINLGIVDLVSRIVRVASVDAAERAIMCLRQVSFSNSYACVAIAEHPTLLDVSLASFLFYFSKYFLPLVQRSAKNNTSHLAKEKVTRFSNQNVLFDRRTFVQN
jgi:hypothetical protein